MRDSNDIVYIIGDDKLPVSITVGELFYSRIKLGITYQMFETYKECKEACDKLIKDTH